MRNDLQNVANVARPHILNILTRATIKTTGIDPERDLTNFSTDVYTVRASACWVAVHLIGLRPAHLVPRYASHRSVVTRVLYAVNIARSMQGDLKYLNYKMAITIIPKIYAEYCRLFMLLRP